MTLDRTLGAIQQALSCDRVAFADDIPDISLSSSLYRPTLLKQLSTMLEKKSPACNKFCLSNGFLSKVGREYRAVG